MEVCGRRTECRFTVGSSFFGCGCM